MCLFLADQNPNLDCIEVDDPMYSNNVWATTFNYPYNIDPFASFSSYCANPCSLNNINEIQTTSNIYPNPAHDYTIIEVSEYPTQLYLIDLQGKIVFNDEIRQSIYRMDVSSFEKGIYILKIGKQGSKLAVK